MGAVCYADDIALLAPCPSAIRTMLFFFEEYAVTHGLKFNPDKTQLIRFRSQSTFMYHHLISLDGVDLKFSDTVMHLGHLLSYNLDDTPDIIRVTKDLNRKANFVLCTFKSADPFVKCFLIKAYCLSLYDCTLWSLSCKSLHVIQVAMYLGKYGIYRHTLL